MRKTTRTMFVATAVAGVVAVTGGTAFADDCFNASRSATGNVSAANHSANWYSVAELVQAFIPGVTADQVQAIVQVVNADPRVPANLTLFLVPSQSGNVFELAQNMPTRLATNGVGIDHSDQYPDIWNALMQDIGSVLGG